MRICSSLSQLPLRLSKSGGDTRSSVTGGAFLAAAFLAGCMSGPLKLQETRLHYNEVVKTITEQQTLFACATAIPRAAFRSPTSRPSSSWFYIDATDHDTKATFSLLMELTRLDLQAKPGDRPLLTLPLSR
jgi:hypothetical protein